jgi:hypothetical protein
MADALATEAPAQAAMIAKEETSFPAENGDTVMTEEKPEINAETETEVKAEVEPDVIPEKKPDIESDTKPKLVKPVIEKPEVQGKSEEELETLLTRAAKQGMLFISLLIHF